MQALRSRICVIKEIRHQRDTTS